MKNNASELVDNIQGLSDSEDQETVIEILGEIPESPNQEQIIYEKDTLLITPSKFKTKRKLFSPRAYHKMRKIETTNDSSKNVKLKKKILITPTRN